MFHLYYSNVSITSELHVLYYHKKQLMLRFRCKNFKACNGNKVVIKQKVRQHTKFVFGRWQQYVYIVTCKEDRSWMNIIADITNICGINMVFNVIYVYFSEYKQSAVKASNMLICTIVCAWWCCKLIWKCCKLITDDIRIVRTANSKIRHDSIIVIHFMLHKILRRFTVCHQNVENMNAC